MADAFTQLTLHFLFHLGRYILTDRDVPPDADTSEKISHLSEPDKKLVDGLVDRLLLK